jgi:transcriptional regulator with XRE-family HTH domain
MSFGSRLLEARKIKGISQEELAKFLGTKGPAIGRYERDEMKPSIEVAAKMADYLDVSLDYLVGKTDVRLDNKTMKRILEVQNLKTEVQDKIFEYIDLIIRDTKAKQAYS